MPTLLFVSAFEPEIDLLAKKISGESLRESLGVKLFPKQENITIEVLEAGVGAIQGALSLQKRLLQLQASSISEIIFLGSAGIYPSLFPKKKFPSYGEGCYACSHRFCYYDRATVEGKAKQPDLLCAYLETIQGPFAVYLSQHIHKNLHIQFFAKDLTTNTTPSISLEMPTLSKNFAAQWELENLEAFGLAFAASQSQIPFSAYYALTNKIGQSASREWQKHFRVMSILLQKMVMEVIKPPVS